MHAVLWSNDIKQYHSAQTKLSASKAKQSADVMYNLPPIRRRRGEEHSNVFYLLIAMAKWLCTTDSIDKVLTLTVNTY